MSLLPPPLKKGDGIGIAAPAGPVTPSEISPGIALMESLGYRVFPSAHLYEKEGYLAGDDEMRLADLHAQFLNERVKAIFCARGGYGVMRILPGIDFDLIRRNPKILVGYSDITALLLAIQKWTGMITFHGPLFRDMATKERQNLDALVDVISGNTMASIKAAQGKILRSGEAKGTLIGGNLSLICHLIGTRFMPSLDGTILFLEEKGEPLYRIDRMVTHLRLSGVLDACAGIALGAFEECGDPGLIQTLVEERMSGLPIPILSGFPFGHSMKNFTLPVGAFACLDTGLQTLSILEPAVQK